MTIPRAEQLAVPPLHCEDCLLANNRQLCRPAAAAIVKASLAHNATLELPPQDPERTAAIQNLCGSMIYGPVAQAAGETACRANQAFYNRTAAQSLMEIMS